jgi:hypothetical protein
MVRKTAANLVGGSKSYCTWTEYLSKRDRKYVDDVVAAMRKRPEATPRAVAMDLIKELGINRTQQTVASTLRNMINEKS